MKKLLYRIWIIIVFPLIPLWLLIGLMVQAAPDYWSDLKDFYRLFPKAFRNGGPI